MKKIFIFILSVMVLFSVNAQETEKIDAKTQKELQKEAKKEARKKKNEEDLAATKSMIENHQFVLEADFLSGKSGNKVPVNSTINFIIIDTTYCMIQIGNPTGIGYNGVGGVTTAGNVSSYTVTKNKKDDSFTIQVVANTNLGTYDIIYFISGSGQAEASLTGITPGLLRYYGRLVPLDKSRVYKARISY